MPLSDKAEQLIADIIYAYGSGADNDDSDKDLSAYVEHLETIATLARVHWCERDDCAMCEALRALDGDGK